MKSVQDILSEKGTDIWSVKPDDKVIDALKQMAEKNIGAVLVINNGEIEGIFSERDYARKVALEGKSSRELLVKEIMSPNVLFVTPDKNCEDCMALMIKKRVRHLPVLEDGKLKGIISIGDVVKAIMDHKEHTIDQLEQYITNRR